MVGNGGKRRFTADILTTQFLTIQLISFLDFSLSVFTTQITELPRILFDSFHENRSERLFDFLGSNIFSQRIRHLKIVQEFLLFDGVHSVTVNSQGNGETRT
jgi:hypothetical protein